MVPAMASPAEIDFADIDRKLKELECCIDSCAPVTPDEQLLVGVDLGTAYIVVVVLNSEKKPVACALEYARVVRDGLVVDYTGATRIVKKLVQQLEERLGRPAHPCRHCGAPWNQRLGLLHPSLCGGRRGVGSHRDSGRTHGSQRGTGRTQRRHRGHRRRHHRPFDSGRRSGDLRGRRTHRRHPPDPGSRGQLPRELRRSRIHEKTDRTPGRILPRWSGP